MAVDLKMLQECKKRFENLYKLSVDERNALRNTDGYQIFLMDLWEMAAAASGNTTTRDEFFHLLGQAVYGVMTENVKIVD